MNNNLTISSNLKKGETFIPIIIQRNHMCQCVGVGHHKYMTPDMPNPCLYRYKLQFNDTDMC